MASAVLQEARSTASGVLQEPSGPVRTCTGCRARRHKDQLIRVVRGPDGIARLAAPGMGGRGGYTCPDEECITRAFASGRLRRSLGRGVKELPGSLLGRMLQESKGRAWQSRGFTK